MVLSVRLLGQTPTLNIEHSVKLQFPTQAGSDYSVYSTTDPDQKSGWVLIGKIHNATGNTANIYSEIETNQHVFYKVEKESLSDPTQKTDIFPLTKLSNGEIYQYSARGFSYLILTGTVPIVIPDIGLELLPLSAGIFTMGSRSSENGRQNWEGPQTIVNITKPFWLGKTEVTQTQWTTIMGSNPSSILGDNLPVNRVSYNDAIAFCEKINNLNRDMLPTGYRFSLPTQAQWEYACRAATTSRFYFGDENSQLEKYGWYTKNSKSRIHPVGGQLPNDWGFFDMHGNVYEWCLDWISNGYPGGEVYDPQGPKGGSLKALRGGSYADTAEWCRSASRGKQVVDFRDKGFGFRLALSAVPTD